MKLSGAAFGHRSVDGPRALAPGTAVERFTVLGLVGRGGMGEVYAAYDPSLDRRVALKMMHSGASAQDPHGHARTLREAKAIAQLSHPNVVVVYEVGTFHGRVFMAMELVDGVTLSEWLAERQRSWREIVGVFLQAARGLSAAHRAGFVHRDFKPENVMVSDEGRVRVMDFGLAVRIEDLAADASTPRDRRVAMTAATALTQTGEQLGTPLYMAPEQFAAERVDARTDQFSFCVALFWALYGAHPFGAGQRSWTSPPKTMNPPAWLRGVIRRGLHVAPEARWRSMEDLAAAMSCEPRRKSRRVLWGAILVGVATVAALAGVSRLERQQVVSTAGSSRMAGDWDLPENAAPASPRPDGFRRGGSQLASDALDAAGVATRRTEPLAGEALTVFTSATTFAAQSQEIRTWLGRRPHRSSGGRGSDEASGRPEERTAQRIHRRPPFR